MKIHLNFDATLILRKFMVSEMSVIGLKSAINFFNSHGTNDLTSMGGINLKKGKRKARDIVSGLKLTFLFFFNFCLSWEFDHLLHG